MTATEAVGRKLVDLCNQGKHLDAIAALYSRDIVSVEACAAPGFEQVQQGIDKIRAKNEWWLANHEWHGGGAEGPFPHGEDRFAVIFSMDVTPKAGPMQNRRMQMKEIALYTVKDGKIAREEFFYSM